MPNIAVFILMSAGVFTSDPRLVKNARLLPQISFEEMIELAASGAQVMMGRAVEIGRRFGIDIYVGSSFEHTKGTQITFKENVLEKLTITGIASQKDVALIQIRCCQASIKNISQILDGIAAKKVNIILLTSEKSTDGDVVISVILHISQICLINSYLEQLKDTAQINGYDIHTQLAQVCTVGYGIAENHGVAARVFSILLANNIEVLLTSTSEIKISVIVPGESADHAVRALHEAFELHAPASQQAVAA